MRNYKWQIFLGAGLIVLSVLFYFLHYLIFKDLHHIFLYLVGDVAFVFIEVLMVTLIIHQLLNIREKRAKLEKLNMVIGAFFSEVGTKLIASFSNYDPNLDNIKKNLVVSNDWSKHDFYNVSRQLKKYQYGVEIKKVNLEELKGFLQGKSNFLLRLLENPNLLEHEYFTELLRAVFHLTEELLNRKDTKELPDTDYEHLANDIKRVYISLVCQWVDYMQYLKNFYPYLFSLAMRTNPFDQNASPIVK